MHVAVPTGGVLFEEFLQYNLPEKPRRLWTRTKRRCIREQREMTELEFAMWGSGKASVQFFFHILSSLDRRGQAASRQLFYVSLLFKDKGMSRSGLDMLSGMSLGLSNRTFDEAETNEVQVSQDAQRSCGVIEEK